MVTFLSPDGRTDQATSPLRERYRLVNMSCPFAALSGDAGQEGEGFIRSWAAQMCDGVTSGTQLSPVRTHST
jgi:hypothetical protein